MIKHRRKKVKRQQFDMRSKESMRLGVEIIQATSLQALDRFLISHSRKKSKWAHVYSELKHRYPRLDIPRELPILTVDKIDGRYVPRIDGVHRRNWYTPSYYFFVDECGVLCHHGTKWPMLHTQSNCANQGAHKLGRRH